MRTLIVAVRTGLTAVAMAVAAPACVSDEAGRSGDAGAPRDGAVAEDAGGRPPPARGADGGVSDGAPASGDGGEVTDGGHAAADAAPACDDACRAQTLTVDFGGGPVPFERAVYGLTAPAAASGDAWTLHVEALHGGEPGCPREDAPTPERTLVIANVPLPMDRAPLGDADGIRVTLLDFEGRLLAGAPLTRATRVTVTPVAWALCPDCFGRPAPSHPDGFFVFDLEASFPEGVARGRVHAVHCDSLDAAE